MQFPNKSEGCLVMVVNPKMNSDYLNASLILRSDNLTNSYLNLVYIKASIQKFAASSILCDC